MMDDKSSFQFVLVAIYYARNLSTVSQTMSHPVAMGLILLIIGNFFSALYDVSVKWLPDDANAASFLLIRQIISVLILAPVWLFVGKPVTQKFKFHLWRATTGSVGALFFIIGLMALPLATVSSLFYSAPLMIILLGFLFLKEHISLSQTVCAVLGFAGIVIMLRPSEISWSAIAVLIAAFTFALNQLSLRRVPKDEPVMLTLILYNLLGIPLIFVVCLIQGFAGLSWQLFGVAVLSNLFLLAYHWFCVLAYRNANAGEIAIGEYSGMLFVVLFGWVWFGEWLDATSWLGAGLIVLPSLCLPWLFAQLKPKPTDEVKAS